MIASSKDATPLLERYPIVKAQQVSLDNKIKIYSRLFRASQIRLVLFRIFSKIQPWWNIANNVTLREKTIEIDVKVWYKKNNVPYIIGGFTNVVVQG